MTNSNELRKITLLSDLLQYALQDFITLVDSGAPVSMQDWLEVTQEGKCVGTCVAGAVMYETLGLRNVGEGQSLQLNTISLTPFNMMLIGESYDVTPESYLLFAINQIRSGKIYDAYQSFNNARQLIEKGEFERSGKALPKNCPDNLMITPYDESPQNFFFDCGTLYALLIQHGL